MTNPQTLTGPNRSSYLQVPFNSTGSQTSLRPLPTESTQPSTALQIINTLLTVVRGLLSSQQNRTSWMYQLQTIPGWGFRSQIRESENQSWYFNKTKCNCLCFTASTYNHVLAKCVVIYWYLIRANMTKETSAISVKCGPEVISALYV